MLNQPLCNLWRLLGGWNSKPDDVDILLLQESYYLIQSRFSRNFSNSKSIDTRYSFVDSLLGDMYLCACDVSREQALSLRRIRQQEIVVRSATTTVNFLDFPDCLKRCGNVLLQRINPFARLQ